MKLVADVGGTKTLLALADDKSVLHQASRFINDDYADFPAVIAAYLGTLEQPVTGGCFAVAGPVDDDGRHARLTNRPWVIDCTALEVQHDISGLSLINDFAGAALGVTASPDDQLICLQAGDPLSQAPKLVLGAGTGLGVALLLPQAGGWRVVPGEGGHIGFSPRTTQQDALIQWLRPKVGRVINEHFLSGNGIAHIDAFLRGLAVDAPRRAPDDIAVANDVPALETMKLFAEIYGAVAGDLALLSLARGGVYLAGGIAAKNLDLMRDSVLLNAFNAKGVYERLTARMPVYVASDPALGLLGAAVMANAA